MSARACGLFRKDIENNESSAENKRVFEMYDETIFACDIDLIEIIGLEKSKIQQFINRFLTGFYPIVSIFMSTISPKKSINRFHTNFQWFFRVDFQKIPHRNFTKNNQFENEIDF